MPTLEECKTLLRTVGLFAEASEAMLTALAELLKHVQTQSGAVIFTKGDDSHDLYIVVSGRVLIHDGDRRLNELGPAEAFGEVALLDDLPRMVSAMAPEDSELLTLEAGALEDLLLKHPDLTHGMFHHLTRMLRQRADDMATDYDHLQRIARLTAAAAALELGTYDPRSLDQLAAQPDPLGQLARVFQRMANEVVSREQALKKQLLDLTILIDENKSKKDVEQITNSERFQRVAEIARRNREERNQKKE